MNHKEPQQIYLHTKEDIMAFTTLSQARRSIFITWNKDTFDPEIVREYQDGNYYFFFVKVKTQETHIEVKFRIIWLYDESQHL